MATDNFCFYLQNRLVQTSQTGGQQYSDTSAFSIPCLRVRLEVSVRYRKVLHCVMLLTLFENIRLGFKKLTDVNILA